MAEERNGVTLVLFSGDMDSAIAAFNIAVGAAAGGRDTAMFFTFWGVKAIQKGNLTGSGLFGRMMGLLNRGGIERIGPSRFNFGGLGRWMFKKMMKDHNIMTMSTLRQTAIDLGVRLVPCQMSMEVMEISRDNLIDEAEDAVGVPSMLEMADQSKSTFFI